MKQNLLSEKFNMENFFKKLDKIQKEMSADIEKKQVLKQSS